MKTARPKLRQFFSYFGGKLRNGPRYPEPTCDKIIEPFAGGAGYSHLYYDRDVSLYDVNPVVVAVWEYLINARERDILSLPILRQGEDITSFTQLSEGERYFIGFWLARASATPRKRLTSWSMRYPNRLWGEHIRATIAGQVELINHWSVRCISYNGIPNETATWFVDPPYVKAGGFYPCHDVDYQALATWCRNLPGQAIVCEAEGASWLPFRPLYEHKGIQRAVRREVVWLSS